MAFVVHSRQQSSILHQDDANPLKYSIDAVAGMHLNYASSVDGDIDTPVNMSTRAVDNAVLDGWVADIGPWHYGLGIKGGQSEDGWVGFGGRQGAHRLWFRLNRVIWFNYADREWSNIATNPDYDRANLSHTAHTWTTPTTGENITVNCTVDWSSVWTTPGGGDVSLQWSVQGRGLKELVYINQEARDWIAANRPNPGAWNNSDTYFAMVFEIDHSDVPRWVKNGVLENINGDFDDGDGSESIEIRDSDGALGRLLGLMPVSDAWVEDADGEEIEGSRVRMRKRIYTEGGNTYLLAGLRLSQIAAMPSGTLVFDPTLNPSVAATADDGFETAGTTIDSTSNRLKVDASNDSFFRVQLTGIASEDTVDEADIDLYVYSSTKDSPGLNIYCEDADTSAALTGTSGEISAKSQTTANTNWSATDMPVGYNTSPDLTDEVQEVIDRGGWSAGNYLGFILVDDATGDSLWPRSVEWSSGAGAPTARIVYTAASSDLSVNNSDQLNISETVTPRLLNFISITNQLNISDTLSPNLVSFISQTDQLDLTDTAAVLNIYNIIATDQLDLSDTAAQRLLTFISVADQLDLSESVTVAIAGSLLLIAATDQLDISDAATPSLLSFIAAVDQLDISDTLTPNLVYQIAQIDQLDLSDTVSLLTIFGLAVSDQLNISDTFTPETINYISASDQLNLSESASLILEIEGVLQINLSDQLNLTDTFSPETINYIAASDQLDLSETAAPSILNFIVASDQLTLTDTATSNLESNIAITDLLQLSDSVTVTIALPGGDLSISITDTLNLQDSQAFFFSLLLIAVTETLTMSESVTVSPSVVGTIDLTLKSRSLSLTLKARSLSLTLKERP